MADNENLYRSLMLMQGANALNSIMDNAYRRSRGMPSGGTGIDPMAILQLQTMRERDQKRTAALAQLQSNTNIPENFKQAILLQEDLGASNPALTQYARSLMPGGGGDAPWYARLNPETGGYEPAPGAVDLARQMADARLETPESVAQKAQARILGQYADPAVAARATGESAISGARRAAELPYSLREIGARGAEARSTAAYEGGVRRALSQQEYNQDRALSEYRTHLEETSAALKKTGDQAGGAAASVFDAATQIPAHAAQLGRLAEFTNGMMQAGIRPGVTAGGKVVLSKVLQEAGLNPEAIGLPKDVSSYEAFSGEAGRQLGDILKEVKLAPMSDSDRSIIMGITINPNDAPETIRTKINVAASALERSQKNSEFLDQRINTDGITPQQAMAELRRNSRLQPIFSAEQRQSIAKLNAETAKTAPSPSTPAPSTPAGSAIDSLLNKYGPR